MNATTHNPPFRADQVGSLLRPAHLIEAREKYRKRIIDRTELQRIEDDATEPPCDNLETTDKPPCDTDSESIKVPTPMPTEKDSVIVPPDIPADGFPNQDKEPSSDESQINPQNH